MWFVLIAHKNFHREKKEEKYGWCPYIHSHAQTRDFSKNT